MFATMSADHRVGDGAEGAIFMNEFKQPRYIKIEANKSGDGIKEIHSGTLI